MTKLSRVLQFALAQRWALDVGFHSRMFQVLERHADGGEGMLRDLRAALSAETAPRGGDGGEVAVDRGVAVIPIHGVIAHRASAVDDICSDAGTSVEHIRRDLDAALANPDVKAIVLDVDSPGGSVAGLDQLAGELRAARAVKPIVAHTDGMMASAAYWLASQSTKVYATRDSDVGSIGIIASFLDNHRALQDRGLDPVVLKSVPGKGGMQSNGTFGDANRADAQREIDHFHGLFVEAVAAGRGVPLEKATAMGDGRVYIGREAVERGYVDGLQSFASTMRFARQLALNGAKAAADVALPEPEEIPLPEATAAEGPHVQENDPMTKTTNEPANPAPAAAMSTAVNLPTAADGMKAERDRCTAINNAAAPEQRELAAKLVAEGTPLPEALGAIAADLRVRLDQARVLPAGQHQPLARGNSAQVAAATPATEAIEEMEEGEDKWSAQWKADKKLRAEFNTLAAQTTNLTVRDENGRPRAVTGLDLYLASMRNQDRARVVANRSLLQKDKDAEELP